MFLSLPSFLSKINEHILKWGLKKKHLFLTVLDAGKSKIKVPADLVSG